jgi:hypothetical protein
MRTDALHWFLMAWSRGQKWFVVAPAVLVVVWALLLFVPKRHGGALEPLYDRIKIGMKAEDLRGLHPLWADSRSIPNDVWTTQFADGEELIIRFGPDSRVIRTEYHEGRSLTGQLRDWCENLARMLHW